jgi:3',5'-cyclic AMP phosphodiesterase CpdA
MGSSPPLRARILWPALGFPAFVTPREQPGARPFADGDATRCIAALVISNHATLSRADAARCLRYVPWADRGRRHIPDGHPGSFRESDLEVRDDQKEPRLTVPRPKDRYTDAVMFGGDKDGLRGVVAGLSRRVKEIYAAQGMHFLHEIRVSEQATARLANGRYQLFWNNASANESAPSDEMALLLAGFARPRRMQLGKIWQQHGEHLMEEYEYDYGGIHEPYRGNGAPKVRAEILHPLFIERTAGSVLRIGHITDTHVDVRNDVYGENLRQEKRTSARFRNFQFNNWNDSFSSAYTGAKADSDVILLTGDLIDYGRGHWGLAERKRLGENAFYHVDRNWFLFQHLLASADAYKRPVYTILGNHDWRLNPYTPFAVAGAPDPTTLFHGMVAARKGTPQREEQRAALAAAHGDGFKRIISYVHAIEKKWQLLFDAGSIKQMFKSVFGGSQTADIKDYPTETRIESVEWYLLAINPFLDYWFSRPHGQQVLMLDWAEDENVFFQEITNGRKHGINFLWLVGGSPGSEGPKARNALTDQQKWLVDEFAGLPGKAKVIGIHVPPIAPWADWGDVDLVRGLKEYPAGATPRGNVHYAASKPGGFPKDLNAHPLYAIRPDQRVSSDPVFGMDASYNSFERHRPWFIKRLFDGHAGVRAVFSGHIHRNGLFAVYTGGKHRGALAGQYLIQALPPSAIAGAAHPRPSIAPLPAPENAHGVRHPTGPLYVNTTSAGPRGNSIPRADVEGRANPGYARLDLASDGTIQRVEFKDIALPAFPTTTTRRPARATRPAAPRPAPKRVPAGVP